MKDYDSDSDIDSQDFTETNVLLGYAQKELGDDVISHLGGTPEWIDPSTPPSATLARCKVCNDMMALLLQLDAHLPDRFPGHDRRLFVFACRKTKCRRQTGSIRALRSVRISRDAPAVIAPGGRKKDVEEKKPIETNKVVTSTGLGESLFGAKSLGGSAAGNPFGGGNPFAKPAAAAAAIATPKAEEVKDTPSIAKSTDALPATFSEKLSINNPLASKPKAVPTPPEPWPTTLAKAYPVLYMDAEYETLDPEPEMKLPAHATIEKMEVEDTSASSSGGGNNKEDANAFESSMDATFQRFADRMAQNPDQVIRYEYAGVPLLYSDSDAVGKMLAVTDNIKGKGMPRCQNCGAGRTFEVQITPHAITELEADDMNLDGMDWGTIIVGVCEMDCQESLVEAEKVGYLEEWAGVQWEELNQE